MSVYLAHHHVCEWADKKTLENALALQQHAVNQLTVEGNQVRAVVRAAGHHTYTRFKVLQDGSVLSDCPCPQSQHAGTVCVHVVAAGLVLAAQTEDTRKERRLRIAARKEREKKTIAVREPSPLSGRTASDDFGNVNARIRLRLPAEWKTDLAANQLTLHCRIEIDGKRVHPPRIKPGRKLVFSPEDLELLYILEDMAHSDICPSQITCDQTQFSDLLHALCRSQLSVVDQKPPLEISETPALSALQLTFHTNPPCHLQLKHTAIPQGDIFLSLSHDAWLLENHTIYHMEAVLPKEWSEAYHEPLRVPAHRILSFMRKTLPALKEAFPVEDETNIPCDPIITKGTPSFTIHLRGGLDNLQILLLATYAGCHFQVNGQRPSPDDAVPDPKNPHQFIARNPREEQVAYQTFSKIFGTPSDDGSCHVSGQQAMLATMTEAIPQAESHDWNIIKDSAFALSCDQGNWIETEIHILPYKKDSYKLELHYRDEAGNRVSSEAVEGALSVGQTMLDVRGETLLLETNHLRSIQAALAECTQFRETVACITRIHAGFIASLAAHNPRLHVYAPPEWVYHAEQLRDREHLPDIHLSSLLENKLRGYQKAGIRWLRFLTQHHYAGILADEMGLGKTVQALAWIQQQKNQAAEHHPAMVVCPTSLLVNWGREVERFVPELSYCIISGTKRKQLLQSVEKYDIVITSYALLRRDTDHYAQTTFSSVILDEAQHIKNRSTQNAVAAKRLNTRKRLVLTGTPIENSVSDLWSIMDFLMPGYLGSHNSFRIRFEQPVKKSAPNSEKALEHLRCKLAPFMLRRLKSEVAAEMPPKVTRIATTPMLAPQQRLYQRLLSSYYEQISSLVDAQGFERSRFSVFSALLRLRQCCCHPALLRQIKGTDEMGSAKMDLFFELLDEAMDGGHRVLVFSQFVQMLHILRKALSERNIRFSYLDGATRNRMEQVDQFNNNPDVPVFLVSLKAGGSGLNLTGANVVIHYDPWWNPAVEDQATDRTHRIGQTQTVYSIKLVTENSIEQKVIELQERKRQIINAAMGATGGFTQHLTWSDIQTLLKP